MSVLTVVVLTLVTWVSGSTGDECYAQTASNVLLAGSKTGYDNLPHHLVKITTTPITGRCKPVMIWMVAKNGVTWPTESEIKEYFDYLQDLHERILKATEELKGFCDPDKNLFLSWKPQRFTVPSVLHPTGQKGLREMGKRVRNAFPRIFMNAPFSKEHYIVQYGKKEWSALHDSASEFIQGVFGKYQELVDYGRFDDHVEELNYCKERQGGVIVRPTSPDGEEINCFEVDALKDSYQRIRQRLNMNEKELTDVDIDSMMVACAYESAWRPQQKSPWCVFLSKEDVQAQDYVDDVNFYYKTAYKDEFNKKAACPLVKDMITRFKLFAEKPTARHPRGVFYFGIDKHVNLVTTALGMMVENKYLGMHEVDPARNYRTAKFLGFQGNMMAVLHQCHPLNDASKKTYRVKFFLDEVPAPVADVELNELIKQHASSVNEDSCTYDFCNEDTEARQQYRATHPYPLGVVPSSTPPTGQLVTDPTSSSLATKHKKKSGSKKWIWWLVAIPGVIIFSCASSVIL